MMNKIMNKAKMPEAMVAQQPKTTQIAISQPLHDNPRSRPVTTASPTHEDIARRAYLIYVEKGRPEGQSEQIWQQAEQEQRSRNLSASLSR